MPIWRFIVIVLVAAIMGVVLAHVVAYVLLLRLLEAYLG